MTTKTIKEKIIQALAKDERIWNEAKDDLNQTLLLDLVEKIDEKIIGLLLEEESLREKFFVKIKDVYVFKMNAFKFFMEENRVDNSYTQYKNRIGLTDGKRFLSDSGDVVLDFPYKDCVLAGGQSTEEGEDIYFEYEEEKTRTVKGEKVTEPAGYQEKRTKRKEVFFNQILAKDEIDRLFDPKALVNWKRYTQNGEEEVRELQRDDSGTLKENLIIKGNNLLALHSLKKQFAGKVKLIYIDPPYNTGNDDFGYNDQFNHSAWLTFMKNRLEAAKALLNDYGSIWINIDDDQAHYLKILCDEVFGRSNFVRNVLWQKRTSPDTRATIGDGHDHILVFSRNLELFKQSANRVPKTKKQIAQFNNPDNDVKGPWVSSDFTAQGYRPNQMYKITTPGGKEYYPPEGRCWKNIEPVFLELVKENGIWFGKDGCGVPRRKTYLSEVENNAVWSWWTNKEVGHNQEAKKESIALFGADNPFPTPKPERLLERIIHVGSNQGELVLDFFAGSGTTVAVAHKMNRQYITVEQMDYIETTTSERLKMVVGRKVKPEDKLLEELEFDKGGISKSVDWQGGGDFIYLELAQWNENAKAEILACESLADLEKLFEGLYETYFLNYNLKLKEFKEKVMQEENFRALSLDEQKRMFLAMLDLNQLYVQETEMEDKRFGISEKDQALTKQFYNGA